MYFNELIRGGKTVSEPLKTMIDVSFGSFNNFVDEKYILSDNAFGRRGKWNLETAIKFPLFNRKKNKI